MMSPVIATRAKARAFVCAPARWRHFVFFAAVLGGASACGETRLSATELTESAVGVPSGGRGSGGAGFNGGSESSTGGLGGATSSSGGSLPYATAPFFLSDDFEEELTWDTHATEGSVIERVSEKSRSGEHSMRFTQGSKVSEAYIALPIDPRMTGDRLHVRAWYYIPSGAVNGRVNLVSSNGVTAPDVNLLTSGAVEIYLHQGAVRVSTRAAVYPYDRWFCLETGLLVDPDEGELHVSVGGERVLSVVGKDTTTDSFTHAVVGLTWVEMEQSDAIIYVDDLAVDYLPLPCN